MAGFDNLFSSALEERFKYRAIAIGFYVGSLQINVLVASAERILIKKGK